VTHANLRTVRTTALCVLALALLPLGCGLFDGTFLSFGSSSQRISASELWDELDDYVNGLSTAIQTASTRIIDASPDRRVGRETVSWKIAVIPQARRALTQDDPLAALLDLWALCVQQRIGLEATPPVADFGRGQSIAIATTTELESDIVSIAAKVLTPVEIESVAGDVLSYAIAHPLGRGFARDATAVEERSFVGYSALNSVLAIPLSPFRALEGIDTGAQAIADVASVADRFASIIAELPEQLRWHVEILLYDLDQQPALNLVASSTDRVAMSSSRLAGVAEGLPDRLDASLERTLGALTEESEGLLAVVEEARATAAETRGAIGAAQELAERIESAIGAATTAGDAWRDAFAELNAMKSESGTAPADPNGGFDLKDLESAAIEVARAGAELRAAIGELRGLLVDESIDRTTQRVDEAAERAVSSTRDATAELVDLAFRRALWLVLAVLAASVAYRFVARGLARRG
jgi:hypothetical protein